MFKNVLKKLSSKKSVKSMIKSVSLAILLNMLKSYRCDLVIKDRNNVFWILEEILEGEFEEV